jgi:ComF family protein
MSARDWSLALKNIVFPIFCKQCGVRLLTEENGYFCPTCWEASPKITRPFCSLCGRPHKDATGFDTRSNFPCVECTSRDAAPSYGRVWGARIYDESMREAVKLLKFNGKVRLAAALGEVMREFAMVEVPCEEYDYLAPVPLYRVRERERGFNQSLMLVEEILPAFPAASILTGLKRIRPTRTQSRLKDPGERKRNVEGAFAYEGESLKGRSVLLVDDVVTSGGTVSECARALRRAGAKVDVFAATLA